MSTTIKIGHASISESGSINGTAGDQTKAEVYIKSDFNILSKNYNVVLRPKSKALAEKSVAACIAGCNNNNIGYSQSTRNTLYNLAKANGYNLATVGLCNTDCSAFMTVCAIAGGAKIDYGSNAPTTSNMRTRFQQSGHYNVLTAAKYTTKTDNLKSGDILVCEGHHTVMVLENGSAITEEVEEVVEPVTPEEPEKPTTPEGITATVKITTYSIEAIIDKIEDTKASINIKVMEQKTGSATKTMSGSKVAKYTWSYQLIKLSDNTKTTKEFQISSGTYKLSLDSLDKDTAYAIQVFAEKSGAPAFCSQKIIFTTAINKIEQTEQPADNKKFTGDTNIINQAYLRVGNSYKPVIIYKM